MTLPYTVDRVEFDRLVAEAQRRIAARSAGRWTQHAPVDPGMTLLELYAWQLEQRGYVADQLSPPLVQALLRLLGDELQPARPAATVLELEPDAGRSVLLTAGTTAAIVGRPDLRFSTRHGLWAARLAGPIELHTWQGDRTLDLGQRPVPILRADRSITSARIVIELTDPPPAGARLGLLVDVVAPGRIAPQWSPDAVEVPPPAKLDWRCAWAGLAPRAAGADLEDGTGGLRRPGIVAIRAPSGAGPRLVLTVRAADATFTSSPLVRAIRANAAIADHRSRRHVVTDEPWLALPGRTIELPTDRGLPLPGARVRMTEHDGDIHEWTPVASLASCGPADRVFLAERERARLRFGDGLTGRLPRRGPGVPVIVDLEVGGGRGGNVGPSTWELTVPPGAGIPTIRSRVQAVGGRDEETFDDAAGRIAAAVYARTRAVTRVDHELIAIETTDVAVARAHAATAYDVDAPCAIAPGVVTVFVVPEVEARTEDDVRAGRALAAPVADPGLIAAVQARFDATRLLGSRVDVRAARYTAIEVTVTVASDPWSSDELRRRVAGAVRVLLDPLLGGAAPERGGWPFGRAVQPTEILREVQETLGGDGRVAAIELARAGRPPVASCDELPIPAHALVELSRVDVRIVPPPARGEVLR